MTADPRPAVPLSAVAAALLAAFGTASAVAAEGEEEAKRLTTPESEVSAGVGYVSEDNRRFGQYNGLKDRGWYPLLDADVVRRDDESGTWFRFRGRNLGLDSRDLRFEQERQGDWGVFIDFSQTPRFNPYTVNTGLAGIGTATQTSIPVAPGAGSDYHLNTKRDAIALGLAKAIGQAWDFRLTFRNEEKNGARQWGQGNFGDVRFLTDPIDYTTRQVDAVVSYASERLQLSGGYYGTDFTNRNLALTVNNSSSGLSPMGLPPGNQSHQLLLTGGYNFTATTRGTFNVAYATQTQTDAFPVPPTTVNRGSLDGRVDTKQLQLGLASRPVAKLSLLANFRYEDKNDKTPIEPYLVTGIGTTSTFDGTNEPRSIRTTAGKLEGSYAFPANLKGTLGLDYEQKERNTYRLRSVSHRDKTEETTLRAELRRSISETLTGSLGLAHSERGGSDFLNNIVFNGTQGSNKIAPLHMADRDRDKAKLTLNWTPAQALSVQLRAEGMKDKYSSRSDENLGLHNGRANFFSLDGAYQFTGAWQVTAFVSTGENKLEQASCASSPSNGGPCGAGANSPWQANLANRTETFGAALRGKLRADLELGAEAQFSRFRDEFALSGAGGTANSLPDITTKWTNLKLFADYALRKNAGIRAQLIQDRYRTDDWTWANWTYSDGTRVTENQDQKVYFVGLTGYYRF